MPYDRPPLSKQVLRGKQSTSAFNVDYEKLGVDLHLGRRAVHLDTKSMSLALDNGVVLSYSDLIIATGAKPLVPKAFADHQSVFTLRNIEDAFTIAERLTIASRIAIVGGGFIGCEVAASARYLGSNVTMIEALAAPLQRAIGSAPARVVADLHVRMGVQVLVGTQVTSIEEAGDHARLSLGDGRQVETQTVVLGLGVRPDLKWLEGAGIATRRGVLCDAWGRTSVPHVFAVGDVAEWWNPLSGTNCILEHWTSAVEQAAKVASCIAGTDDGKPLDTVPYFWSDMYDVKIQALGMLGTEDGELEIIDAASGSLYLYARRSVLVGALAFSAPKQLMSLRKMIQNRAILNDALRSCGC